MTAEYLESVLLGIGRGELSAKQYQAALDNAADVRQLVLKQLTARKLDAEPSLPTALGASIEVTGQALTFQGQRDQAVTFLRAELEKWKATSINARIQKNINLLSLEGKPAPPLEVTKGVVGPQPRPLSAHAGHPVLLFFWAHWCSDCKQEIPIIQQIQKTYKAKGLEVIAPTQHLDGASASRAAKMRRGQSRRRTSRRCFGQYYSGLGNVETPISEANFARYGVSTTPTWVMVNAQQEPSPSITTGAMTLDELAAALRR